MHIVKGTANVVGIQIQTNSVVVMEKPVIFRVLVALVLKNVVVVVV